MSLHTQLTRRQSRSRSPDPTDHRCSTMADAAVDLQANLAKLDPAMAAVFTHLIGNTSGLDTRLAAVEESQKAMKQDLQQQIDALAAAVNGTGASAGSEGSASMSIEHMFQRRVEQGSGEDLEATIQKHIQKAMEGIGANGCSDPFAPVKTDSGEFYPCKAWAFGTPIKLSRDAHRDVVRKALETSGHMNHVVEIDARDSSSFLL